MKITVHIYARKKGAIGLWREFVLDLDVDEPTTNKVRLACYDAGYEHISGLNWRIVFENTQKKPA